MNIPASKICMGIAFVFALVATFHATGDISGFAWAYAAAIASMAFAFLVG